LGYEYIRLATGGVKKSTITVLTNSELSS